MPKLNIKHKNKEINVNYQNKINIREINFDFNINTGLPGE